MKTALIIIVAVLAGSAVTIGFDILLNIDHIHSITTCLTVPGAVTAVTTFYVLRRKSRVGEDK